MDGLGQVEVSPKARLPLIAPGMLRAGFDMSGAALVWLAVWNAERNLAIAVDISAGEVEPCDRRASGDHLAGPFPSRRQAEAFAVERLTDAQVMLEA